MKTNTMLYATDFSQSSEAALEYASSLVHHQSAKLLLVHVEEPAPVYTAGKFSVPPQR